MSREDLLCDKGVSVLGYQADFEDLRLGLVLFNHSCGTTLAIEARFFEDLYDGPIFSTRRTGSADCAGYCIKRGELRRCPAQCECAWVREVVNIVANRLTQAAAGHLADSSTTRLPFQTRLL